MINTTQFMKYFRSASALVLALSLSSCSTFGGLLNSYPLRILDQTGSALLGYLAENDPAATPKSLEDRAKNVQDRGMYAGRGASTGVNSSRQSMASR